jgi:hypothetical protein
MISFELASTLVSVVALTISVYTAYRTFFARFQATVYVRPRIILTRINNLPTLMTGCEIVNSSPKSGLIDDVLITIRFRQSNGRGLDRYTFYPSLVRDDFNIFKTYSEIDFEPFQSISVPANARLVKYIAFNSGSDSFTPSSGKAEIDLRFRCSGNRKWERLINKSITLDINDESSSIWSNPQGRTIMLETIENFQHRNQILENI